MISVSVNVRMEDLKKGQIVELKWEYFDHDMDHFEPRLLRMVLVERLQTAIQDVKMKPNGWRTKVFYDSKLSEHENKAVPYENVYYDTWIKLSIKQGNLRVLS